MGELLASRTAGLGETRTQREDSSWDREREAQDPHALGGEEKWRVMRGVTCLPIGIPNRWFSSPSLGVRMGAAEPRYLWNPGDPDCLRGSHEHKK